MVTQQLLHGQENLNQATLFGAFFRDYSNKTHSTGSLSLRISLKAGLRALYSIRSTFIPNSYSCHCLILMNSGKLIFLSILTSKSRAFCFNSQNTEIRPLKTWRKRAAPIPFYYVEGVLFTDLGSAWNNSSFRGTIKNENGNRRLNDLLWGYGWGVRTVLLYFIIRFDMAWANDFSGSSKPIFYISLGSDF